MPQCNVSDDSEDFNAEDTEPCLSRFLYEHNSKNLVKDKTCFKSLENPSCIDLFLTNTVETKTLHFIVYQLIISCSDEDDFKCKKTR